MKEQKKAKRVAAPKPSIVVCRNVVREYRTGEVTVQALRGLNLEIPQGEFIILLGPSGSGKSTAVNIIGGLDNPTSGQVIVQGEDISSYKPSKMTEFRRRKLGFVFQFYNLIPTLTAGENVEFSLRLVSGGDTKKRARDLLSLVGLGERVDHFPSQMSGGQQQRVAIARALANRPPLLLCDEPTGNLDVQTSQQVLQVLQDINKSEGTTVLLITHNMSIPPMADRVVYIRDGVVDHVDVNESPTPIPELAW
jgi:putative ABC transport system ATP-binding protein